jgi:hypothetical protein
VDERITPMITTTKVSMRNFNTGNRAPKKCLIILIMIFVGLVPRFPLFVLTFRFLVILPEHYLQPSPLVPSVAVLFESSSPSPPLRIPPPFLPLLLPLPSLPYYYNIPSKRDTKGQSRRLSSSPNEGG